MTLPTSGPMSLDMIRNEFGGANPVSISNYYSGGPNVRAGTIGTSGVIPASGAINFGQYRGSSNAFTNHTLVAGTGLTTNGDTVTGFAIDAAPVIGTVTPPFALSMTIRRVVSSTPLVVFFQLSCNEILPDNDTVFQRVEITGQFENNIQRTIIYTRASASFFPDPGLPNSWIWIVATIDRLVTGRTYTLLIVRT